jgi:CRISPR-associated protein Csd1
MGEGGLTMLLQRLREFSERSDFKTAPPLYSETPVRYYIELTADGRLRSPSPTDTAEPSDRKLRRGQPRLAPRVQRSSDVKPLLLVDNAEYTLGLAKERSKPDRAAGRHKAYLELVQLCARESDEPSVRAILDFLQAAPLLKLVLPADFDPSATVTFVVDGVFPIDLPSVQAFWASYNDPAAASAPVMQCIVCGRQRPILERLQGKVKGVPGGQLAGTAIISANAEAFESYGLEASLIAPTCADCAERFTKALNALLSSDRHRKTLGGRIAFLAWTKEDVGFDPMTFLDQPDPAQVRDLFGSLENGRFDAKARATPFYATALSGSGGRAVVRDWLDTTVDEAIERLKRWFTAQQIVDPWESVPRYYGIYALAAATVRDARKDLATPTLRALLRSALTDTPLALDLIHQAMRRCRAEQEVKRQHAALIKSVLITNRLQKEDSLVELDPAEKNAAYCCGRLLAILETVQREAIPGVNAGIVDRFFGTASSAPGTVFPRLIQGANHHLAKLRRDKPGAYYALKERIAGALAPVGPTFPRTLTLDDQGRFALGYYHQIAADIASAQERRAAKATGQ